MFDDFENRSIHTRRGTVFARIGGSGPAVLLLHGFPQTGLMWRDVAPLLAARFSVVVADLPGYGASDCPAGGEEHGGMSKRQMATTLVAAMAALGHERFAIVGHDRGGRVAYRAALDQPGAIVRIALLDVIPTMEVWERADARLALAFWPFSLLAQPAPLPERLIGAAPQAVIDDALTAWGSPPRAFPPEVRQAYVDALRDPAHIHAICNEYRAAAGIDAELDRSDFLAERRIACPLLVLWAAEGALADWYRDAGGPLGIWRRWAGNVTGQPIDGGHFFPEAQAALTARLLGDFLSPDS